MIELLYCDMQHDEDVNGAIEKSDKKAFLLDNDDLLKSLGFHDKNAFKKVDYIREVNDIVYLVEFTDLSNEIAECIEFDLILSMNSDDMKKFIKDCNLDLKVIKKKLWLEVIEEFKGKFIGSIACYERLLRLNNRNDEFKYNLVVVLRNNTDPKYFDFLETHLVGKLKNLTGKIEVRRTQGL